MEKTPVEWLADKYNYVELQRKKDEISHNAAYELKRKYLEAAKKMEKKHLSADLQSAVEILENYRDWRQGKQQDMTHEPKKITKALDVVIAEIKKANPFDSNPTA